MEQPVKGRVLLVDNEPSIRGLIGKVLEINGYRWEGADGFKSAKEKLSANEYEVLVTDKNMPLEQNDSEGGMELIRWVRQKKPDLAIILMTGFPTIDSAVEALKLGAFDYLLKPLDLKLLIQKVDRAIEYRRCVNPEIVLSTYLNLNKAVLEAAGAKDTEIDTQFTRLQESLNNLFQNFRTAERALLDHRQRLAEIASYAENAGEKLPAENPAKEMLSHISKKAAQRI